MTKPTKLWRAYDYCPICGKRLVSSKRIFESQADAVFARPQALENIPCWVCKIVGLRDVAIGISISVILLVWSLY